MTETESVFIVKRNSIRVGSKCKNTDNILSVSGSVCKEHSFSIILTGIVPANAYYALGISYCGLRQYECMERFMKDGKNERTDERVYE
jgi:hypothetical protein